MPHAAPPVAGAGAARVPGGVQELPRPALPGEATSTTGKSKLGVFDDMLATRRKAFADKLPPVQARAGDSRHRAAGEAPRGRRRRDRAGRSRPATASPSPTPRSSTCSQRVEDAAQRDRRARRRRPRSPPCATGFASPRGLLSWQLAKKQTDRVWDAAEGRCSASTPSWPRRKRRDAALAAAQTRGAGALRAASASASPRSTPLLDVHDPARRRARAASSSSAVAGHRRRRARPASRSGSPSYTTQARFAVAQLYDRAYGQQEPRACCRQALSRARSGLRTALLLVAAASLRVGCCDVRRGKAARPTTSRR